jgi:hypothetical protein
MAMNTGPESPFQANTPPDYYPDPNLYKRRDSRLGCYLIAGVSAVFLLLIIAGVAAFFFLSQRAPVPHLNPPPAVPITPEKPEKGPVAGDTAIAPDAVKLDHLNKPLIEPGATGPATPSPPLPPEAELKKLVTDSVLALNQAIRDKDFQAFHASLSAPLQQKSTPASLMKAFQDFVTRSIDLSPVKTVEPVFEDKPAIDDRGRLHLSGYFPTDPRVQFDIKYLYEPTAWKIFSIHVNRLSPSEPGAGDKHIPSRKKLNDLARESILALDQALKTDNFTAFHLNLSQVWQQQTTPRQLKKDFKALLEPKALDLSTINNLVPVLTTEPYLDENGWLQFDGLYPSEPNNIKFELGYVLENNEWKLVKIRVSR